MLSISFSNLSVLFLIFEVKSSIVVLNFCNFLISSFLSLSLLLFNKFVKSSNFSDKAVFFVSFSFNFSFISSIDKSILPFNLDSNFFKSDKISF